MEGIAVFEKRYASELTFPTDGYVFTRLGDEARPFLLSPNSVLKWKPRRGCEWDENTIDVMATTRPQAMHVQLPQGSTKLLHRFRSRDGPFLLFASETDTTRAPFLFSAGYSSADEDVKDGCVYEAKWHILKRHWYLFRQRDKGANTISTIERCLRNINEDITLGDIVQSFIS